MYVGYSQTIYDKHYNQTLRVQRYKNNTTKRIFCNQFCETDRYTVVNKYCILELIFFSGNQQQCFIQINYVPN